MLLQIQGVGPHAAFAAVYSLFGLKVFPRPEWFERPHSRIIRACRVALVAAGAFAISLSATRASSYVAAAAIASTMVASIVCYAATALGEDRRDDGDSSPLPGRRIG